MDNFNFLDFKKRTPERPFYITRDKPKFVQCNQTFRDTNATIARMMAITIKM